MTTITAYHGWLGPRANQRKISIPAMNSITAQYPLGSDCVIHS